MDKVIDNIHELFIEEARKSPLLFSPRFFPRLRRFQFFYRSRQRNTPLFARIIDL